ncbi:glycoside hydrolase family 76 protein [Myriangium duriaei CBS 260.36]|uniref:Mannan endo-1,6-alpha-mannosidase n=1 Tax=Myriangium duriaei CBS 260.36 TaxID=1168546 RepID=A0A9P4IUG5_9PEZI|nr:glycoside hydrolase family 76 protein [Myriangium duriaei CBS 260.36]
MRSISKVFGAAWSILLVSHSVAGITLDVKDPASIKSAASTVAYKLFQSYSGNKTGGVPGLLDRDYYWWEAGSMFGSAIDYWYYTGDAQYNEITSQALLWQVGPNDNYMPPNQSKSLGNDDQCFWAIAAMQAAESGFPNPPADRPQWLSLAQAVFDTQVMRWDNSSCGGGLKWQIFTFNNGYNYKNSLSAGCFFNLASRLAAYTGNHTHQEWATRMYEWTTNVGLISPEYSVFDGTDDTENCTSLNHIQWTQNAGLFIYGASVMWNITQDQVWKQRAENLWNASDVFFTSTNNQVMYEVACEPSNNCDVDQYAFKANLARAMAASIKVLPSFKSSMMPYLVASAQAAARQCNGGSDGITCGTHWTADTWDGSYGVGQQLSALEVIQSLLIDNVPAPLTSANAVHSTSTSSSNQSTNSSTGSTPSASANSGAFRTNMSNFPLLILLGALGSISSLAL